MKKMTASQRSKIEFTDGTTRQYQVIDKRNGKQLGGLTVQYELVSVPGKKRKTRQPVRKVYYWSEGKVPYYYDNEQLNAMLENIICAGLGAELDHCEILSFDVGQAAIPVGTAKMLARKDRLGQQALVKKLRAR